ncbi:MAG: hypothetical protein JW749_04020 [Sedimentisphaerales bacterium]|nr:hypothetical protein [Sedimentisphaerales bacterium]
MKRFSLVLFILGLTASVSADVLVYNVKYCKKGFIYRGQEQKWEDDSQRLLTAYFIVEVNDDGTITGLCFDQWKEKSEGKTRKLYELYSIPTFNLLECPLGKKTIWIITAESDVSCQILKGEAKLKKVGNAEMIIAPKLIVTAIWDGPYEDDRYIGTIKGSWSLNFKRTLDFQGLTIQQAGEIIEAEFKSKGYEDRGWH